MLKKNLFFYFTLGLLGFFFTVSLFAPFLSPYHPEEIHDGKLNLDPIWGKDRHEAGHWLGTDDLGRDLFSRLIYGARVSIGLGFLVVFFSTFIGSFMGLLAGYLEGWVDMLVSRFVDLLMAIPSVLLAIVVVTILGPGIENAVIAVSFVALPSIIRVTRASVMEEKWKLYIFAQRSFGLSHFRILFKHILPNAISPLIVQATLGFSDGVLNIAALGFLGLGVEPPTPEWGLMISDGRAYIESAPWLVILPGVCLLIVIFCFNFLGDWLRDTLDPNLRNVR